MKIAWAGYLGYFLKMCTSENRTTEIRMSQGPDVTKVCPQIQMVQCRHYRYNSAHGLEMALEWKSHLFWKKPTQIRRVLLCNIYYLFGIHILLHKVRNTGCFYYIQIKIQFLICQQAYGWKIEFFFCFHSSTRPANKLVYVETPSEQIGVRTKPLQFENMKIPFQF